jgi:two-component system chemotaxis sensor kinase CheA
LRADDLGPRPQDPILRAQYLAEVADRLARIDDALADSSPSDAAGDVFRHVHTIKGAASAAGDEPMAWFCHGLEDMLRGAGTSEAAAKAALTEVAMYRAVLGGLLEDPEAALATLRGRRRDMARPSMRPLGPSEEAGADGTIRVAAQSVDRLLDHASGIAVARERVAARVTTAAEHARALRRLRADLAESLRLIGPPRPWGAPAAALRKVERAAVVLAQISDELDAASEQLQESEEALKRDAGAARRLLTQMRQTPVRGMFARLAAAASAEARRAGKQVVVRAVSGDEAIDRRLVEELTPPCMQLVRNAIAHGIEEASVREALGKPREATICLTARRIGTRFSIVIEDDGAGVDVSTVRARAVEAGLVTEGLAQAADDQTLLELLFLPGFSMRADKPDLLAGRGVGLDLTLNAVQRLGGTIHLSSRHLHGFEARVDVPMETGLATVVWVHADGLVHAIPVPHAKRILLADSPDARGAPHLSTCLGSSAAAAVAPASAPYVVELALEGGEPLLVGVEAIGATEEVLVRALSPLARGMGPYAGAIVRGDGSIRLALDIHALAPRLRALGRVPEPRASEPPRSRP